MKYVVVGDVHGKIEVVEHFLSKEYEGVHKIFVGDYVDSFDRSVDDQIGVVKLLIKAVEERTDVTALIGNHELSYLRAGMECSGKKSLTSIYMKQLSGYIYENFKRHHYITDDVIVLHAGASKELFEGKEDLKKALEEDEQRLYNIGYYRGGLYPVGGVFWCDFWGELNPLDDLTQIVGHSSSRPKGTNRGIHLENGCYNIDCLDRVNEALEVDVKDGVASFKVLKFMEKSGG